MKAKSLIFYFLLLICHLTSLQARQPYQTTVRVETETGTVTAPNLVDLTKELSGPSIKALIPAYTPNSLTSFNFNIRGVTAIAFFPENSPNLIVELPELGDVNVFTGATRDDSLILFRDFLRNGGNKRSIFKAYAKFSPIDPIAGNPNSLQGQMSRADYLLGQLSPFSGCDPCWNAQPIVHQYQGGFNAGRAFSKGFDTTAITIPLRYSFSPNLKTAFIIDAPLTYLRNGGASSIVGSIGVGLRVPLIDQWSLTPIVRAGSGGTLDLCTSGCFVSAGLTSVYNYKLKDYAVFSLINYAGYFTSTNLWLSGINFTYHLHNYIFKNGFTITSCKGITFCNRPINFSLSFVDSCFTRGHLFIQHCDEIGVSLISNNLIPYFDYDCLSLKFSYQFGEQNYKGYFFDLIYQF